MLLPTLDEAIERCQSQALDGRDAVRLASFVPQERLKNIGFELKEGASHTPVEWNEENVLSQIKKDVDFTFEKALNQRGISASLMNDVLIMWHRILQLPFEIPDYAQYGLPMAKAMAVHFGFDNPIGSDDGDEDKYSAYGAY